MNMKIDRKGLEKIIDKGWEREKERENEKKRERGKKKKKYKRRAQSISLKVPAENGTLDCLCQVHCQDHIHCRGSCLLLDTVGCLFREVEASLVQVCAFLDDVGDTRSTARRQMQRVRWFQLTKKVLRKEKAPKRDSKNYEAAKPRPEEERRDCDDFDNMKFGRSGWLEGN